MADSSDEEYEMMGTRNPWDEVELREIIAHIQIDYAGQIEFEKEKAEISEAPCFELNNTCQPFRWKNLAHDVRATYLAVSDTNVMYLKEKYPKYVNIGCPPCACCLEMSWRQDFSPKVRKLIPFEKITDIEVHETGSNELVQPGCPCLTCQWTPISVEVPVSQAYINTAGSHGPELIISGVQDANGFRRMVMDLKRNGGAGKAPGQQSMVAGPSQIGGAGSAEMVNLLRDIANSNREILKTLQKK